MSVPSTSVNLVMVWKHVDGLSRNDECPRMSDSDLSTALSNTEHRSKCHRTRLLAELEDIGGGLAQREFTIIV